LHSWLSTQRRSFLIAICGIFSLVAFVAFRFVAFFRLWHSWHFLGSRPMSSLKALLLAGVAGLSLFAAAPVCRAVEWKSSFYKCVVNLPDTSPQINPWAAMSSARSEDESGLVGVAGAHRIDFSAYVYLGVIRLDQHPNFQLNDKTVPELEKRYFGTGMGFLRSLQPLRRKDGIPGYRMIGTHQYNGRTYNIVVDLLQANNMIYEVAGLTQYEPQPLKDPDIRSFLESFRVTR
jgi:hypothetical protein